MMPRIGHPSPRTIDNFLSHESYILVPLDARFARPTAACEIAAICSEELIYQSLFARLLNGRPYREEDAAGFITWAQEGWAKEAYFVFLVLAPDGRVAGAIDIKSAELASAETGYWLSSKHSGVMTNAVNAILGIASEAGYHKLHAWVRESNERSIAVLKRAGFREVERGRRDGESLLRFERATSARQIPPFGRRP